MGISKSTAGIAREVEREWHHIKAPPCHHYEPIDKPWPGDDKHKAPVSNERPAFANHRAVGKVSHVPPVPVRARHTWAYVLAAFGLVALTALMVFLG